MLGRVLGLTACLLLIPACNSKPDICASPVVSTGKAAIGGPYTLINQDGITVTEADFIGKPQLIYFGFSFCPDVCPTALQQMNYALMDIDPDGEIFQPIFISVDPERDTPAMLKSYVSSNNFPKGLIGLTGTVEQVEAAKTAYKIYSAKSEDPVSSAGYTVDHASLVFLMDETGDFADVFTHATTLPEMKTRLECYLKTR